MLNFFPLLNQTEQPYYFVFETGNTHFLNNIVDVTCKDRVNDCIKKWRSYDCDDQLIERFLKDFESWFNKNYRSNFIW